MMRITHSHSPLPFLAVVAIKQLHGQEVNRSLKTFFFVRLAIHLKRTELEPSGLLKTKIKLKATKTD
jgi:hypothetical protein